MSRVRSPSIAPFFLISSLLYAYVVILNSEALSEFLENFPKSWTLAIARGRFHVYWTLDLINFQMVGLNTPPFGN